MRRREFINAIAGLAVGWPLAANAQTVMPVIGFINADSPKGHAPEVSAFLKGLGEAGYVDGHNVAIEYRWAEGQNDRLPAMAADLVRRKVAVIVATSTPAAIAAKAATTTIPVVFETGSDPIQLGLVASLSRPADNVTGITQSNLEIVPKRLELLHELLPGARSLALLVNPAEPAIVEPMVKEALAAARALGLELHVLNASSEADFNGVFAKLRQLQAGGLVIGAGPFFTGVREQLGALALRHAVPTIFQNREFATAGGLVSYGSDITDAYRLTGIYAGRILKGDKPADLPVQQVSKVELIINLKAARALGVAVPLPLSGRADELIE